MEGGKLYCNNLNFFRKCDPKDGLGDPEDWTLKFSNTYHGSNDSKLGKLKELKLNGAEWFPFCLTSLEPRCICNGNVFY